MFVKYSSLETIAHIHSVRPPMGLRLLIGNKISICGLRDRQAHIGRNLVTRHEEHEKFNDDVIRDVRAGGNLTIMLIQTGRGRTFSKRLSRGSTIGGDTRSIRLMAPSSQNIDYRSRNKTEHPVRQ